MEIDSGRVNISERHIEDWLWENPTSVPVIRECDDLHVESWIGRQVEVNSGILDLLGIHSGTLVVVEVKKGEIKSDALTQVSRYAHDIEEALGHLQEFEDTIQYDVLKVVVGSGEVSKNVFYESIALDIRLVTFCVKYNLEIDGFLDWSGETSRLITNKTIEFSRGEHMSEYVGSCTLARDKRETIEAAKDAMIEGPGSE